jgi:hypothetical protein
MSLLSYRNIQLHQVYGFLNGCERTPLYHRPTSVTFNQSSWPK